MKNKRFIAMTMAIVLSVSAIGVPVKAQEMTQEYVVMVENDKGQDIIESEYEKIDNLCSEETEIKDVAVLELTHKEAEALEDNRNIALVEENISFEASGKRKNEKNSNKKKDISSEYELKMVQKEERVQEECAVDAKEQWNIDAINANDKEYEQGADKIKVAILDTGVSATEDIDVAGRVNFIEGEEEVNPLYEDISGHGTSVASVIAAKENGKGITGVNPNVELYSVKVLEDDKRASLSNVIKGIYWCIDNDIDIINMSFGTMSESKILKQVIKEADERGILMIAAAGNRGEAEGQSTVEYPAAYEEVLAVGATTPKGNVSADSSLGEEIDLMAPGESVPATGYFDEIVETDGTSMAAAHVTGVASVLWAKDKDKSSDFVKELLRASAKDMDEKGTEGEGLVDLGYALSVYEEFACNYVEGSRTNDAIQENSKDIRTYTDKEVQASWSGSNHAYAVGLYDDTSEYALGIVKIGSKLPDKAPYLTYSAGNTGSFHGHYNYVANYMYVMRMARICWNSGMTAALRDAEYPCSGKGKSQIYNGIVELNKNWNTVLAGETINNHNKARILVGVAIHIAMDVYAHKAYTKDSSTGLWSVHISDSNQDDTSYVPSRWTCSKDIAYDIMNVWKYKLTPDAIEFYQPEHGYKKFKLFSLSTYVERADNESYVCEKTYYDKRTADK
ncbi:MAG: S8 family peptidase [Lachnospiraceae bacterium]|nr:S8 family peptidase [Lachnospiraceae bacterium]